MWLKWVVGRGSASWVWIGGLGSIDGRFETMDLLIGGGSVGLIIGSSDGGSGDDCFLMGLLRWVSNRRRGFLIAWV